MAQTTSITPGKLVAENAAVSVAVAGTTELLDLLVEGINEVGIEIVVTVNNLDAFQVHGKVSKDSTYQVLYSAAGDYTTPVGLIIGTSGDLTAQAAATTGWIFLDVSPLYGLKIMASAVTGAATVTARAIGKAT